MASDSGRLETTGAGGALGDLRRRVFSAGGDFGGQHDPRLLPDGSVTLFDDGTGLGRAPRAVRYRIDMPAYTATTLEQLTDPAAESDSSFGESARRLSGGDWVVGWAGRTRSASALARTPGCSSCSSARARACPAPCRSRPVS